MSHVPEAADVVATLRAAGCVFAEDEAALLQAEARSPGHLAAMVERRVAGEPLEYILGWAEFCGLRIAVTDGVFVPRRRTEFLAHEAIALLQASGASSASSEPHPVVVDLCCGSGALGAAVAAAHAQIELHAADLDPAAVRCARSNLRPPARVYEGDLFDALPTALRGRVDVLLANVPYVPTSAIATLPPEAREHEPTHTLDGGIDGLHILRRVAAAAPNWLAPGGHLLSEISDRQAPLAIDAFTDAGLTTTIATDDEFGATVVLGTADAAT